jgi:hypothetical protein
MLLTKNVVVFSSWMSNFVLIYIYYDLGTSPVYFSSVMTLSLKNDRMSQNWYKCEYYDALRVFSVCWCINLLCTKN